MSAAEVTLLVPCHNAAGFLPRFRECVDRSDPAFHRILCYDDGSTDGTAVIARKLGFEVSEGTVNRGVAFARNQLAALANSEWIHFHDADDLISPDYLSRTSPLLQDGVDVVSCDADWISEGDRDLIMAWRYDPRALHDTPVPYLLHTPMGLNNTIIRRSAWMRIGGCDERLRMWEDADVHFRLARAGFRFRHVPEVLTWSLRRPSSFSHDYRASWRSRLLSLEGYAEQDAVGLDKDDLAKAAENAALSLAHLKDKEAACRAIALARRLGRSPPSSSQLGVRLLKRILPAYTLMQWQARRRNRTA